MNFFSLKSQVHLFLIDIIVNVICFYHCARAMAHTLKKKFIKCKENVNGKIC